MVISKNFTIYADRFLALIIDLLSLYILIEIFIFLKVIPRISIFDFISLIVVICIWCLKDINGKSIGKRIFKLKVIDKKTYKTLAPWKLFIRNVMLFFWIIDVIGYLIGKTSNRLIDKYTKAWVNTVFLNCPRTAY